jgi:hypothetical protein
VGRISVHISLGLVKSEKITKEKRAGGMLK